MGGASYTETTVRKVTFRFTNNPTLHCEKLHPVFDVDEVRTPTCEVKTNAGYDVTN